MSICPACSRPIADSAATCSHCGASVRTHVADPTALAASDAATRVTSGRPPSSAPTSGPRFVPGSIVGGRYRIVGLLGRGGMGEVYRADDLKLGQSVALKFLPPGLERDPERLARFLDEVRTARQVSHANVCRVHDVDEFEGQHFLSMEYVDGEDLASLLRRIGRLPEERAVEVARQICAGLAAVHEAGVLHRDLKPANVMLDGRGRVRLTDFGLASLDGSHEGLDARAGTPAYMAPELHHGGGVTVQSDLYALGLVLYELFTGKPVFEAESAAELSSLHASAMPSSLTTHVHSLDPAIERAVLRCLEKSPRDRPTSALAVSAALPGGDPLAAALAAGETPSPELVAASGTREALHPAKAIGLALLAVLLFVGGAWWTGKESWVAFLPFEKRPEVLQDRAVDLLAQIGYTEDVYTDPVDRAWGWLVWSDVLREIAASDSSRTWYMGVRNRPDAAGYWYRQSPAMFVPDARSNGPVFMRGAVDIMNPPTTTPGEITVVMDLFGRLRRFEAQPRRFATRSPTEPDWSPLFAAAELDTAHFSATEPRYQRFLGPDLRRAWVGVDPTRSQTEIRVEAGAFEGRVVLFNVASSASLQELAAEPELRRTTFWTRFVQSGPIALIFVVVGFVIVLASRNRRSHSADTRGALRLAVFAGSSFLITQGAGAHVLFTWQWAGELWLLLAGATFIGLIVWGTYLAAEPMGRRVWPSMFVTSTRLLSRERVRWRDPLIGRSVLMGTLLGAACFLVLVPVLRWVIRQWSAEAPWPFSFDPLLVMGGRHALTRFELPVIVGMVFLYVSALVVLQRWVRRRWLAAVLAVVVWTLLGNTYGSTMDFAAAFLRFAVFMVVLLRWGVLALLVAVMTTDLAWMARVPDFEHWTAGGARVAITLFGMMTAFAAWAATGTGSERRDR